MTQALTRFVGSWLLGTGLVVACLLASSTAGAAGAAGWAGAAGCAKDVVAAGEYMCVLRVAAANLLESADIQRELAGAGFDIRSETQKEYAALQEAIKAVDANVVKLLTLTQKGDKTFAEYRNNEYEDRLKGVEEKATKAFDELNQQIYKNFTEVNDFSKLELRDPNRKSPANSLRKLFNNDSQLELITALEELAHRPIKKNQDKDKIKRTLPLFLKSFFDKLQADKPAFARPDFSGDDDHNPLHLRVNDKLPHEDSNLVLQKKEYNYAIDVMLLKLWVTLQKVYRVHKFAIWYYYLGDGFAEVDVALPGFIDAEQIPQTLRGEQLERFKIAQHQKAAKQLNDLYYVKIKQHLSGDLKHSERAAAFKLFDDSVASAGRGADLSKVGGNWKSNCLSFTDAELTKLSLEQVRSEYYYNGTFLLTTCVGGSIRAYFNMKLCDENGLRGGVDWADGRFRCANKKLRYLLQRLTDDGSASEEKFRLSSELARGPFWNARFDPSGWGWIPEVRGRRNNRFLFGSENGMSYAIRLNDPNFMVDGKYRRSLGEDHLLYYYWGNNPLSQYGCIRDDIYCRKVEGAGQYADVHYYDGTSIRLKINGSSVGQLGSMALQRMAGHSDLDPVDQGASHSAAVSRSPGQVDMFWVGRDGAIWSQSSGPSSGWEQSKPFQVTGPDVARDKSPVVAVARKSNQIDVFWIGSNGEIKLTWWNENGWQTGSILEEKASARQLAVVARTPESLDVFWTNGIGEIYSKRLDWKAGGWQSKRRISEDCSVSGNPDTCGVRSDSPLVAVARTPDNIDVFWIRKDSAVAMTSWNSGKDWDQKRPPTIVAEGAAPGSGLSAVARSPNNLDVFWVANTKLIKHRGWWLFAPGSGWRDARSLSALKGIRSDTPLAAVARTPRMIEVFWINAAGGVSRQVAHENRNNGLRNIYLTAFDNAVAPPSSAREGSPLSVVNLGVENSTRDVFWLGKSALGTSRYSGDRQGKSAVIGANSLAP